MLAVRLSTLPRIIVDLKPIKDEFGYRPEYRCEYCDCKFDDHTNGYCPQCFTSAYQLNSNYPHVLKARKRRKIYTKHRTELAA